jgi:hypothetical protein
LSASSFDKTDSRLSGKNGFPAIKSAQNVIASLCAKAFAVKQAHLSLQPPFPQKEDHQSKNESSRQPNSSITILNDQAVIAKLCAKAASMHEDRWRLSLQSSQITNTYDDNCSLQEIIDHNECINHHLTYTLSQRCCSSRDSFHLQFSVTDHSSQDSTTRCSSRVLEDVIANLISKASRVALLSQAAPPQWIVDRDLGAMGQKQGEAPLIAICLASRDNE